MSDRLRHQKDIQVMKIAILLASNEKEDSRQIFPEESVLFELMLNSVSDRFCCVTFPMQTGRFPPSLSDFDGFIITGVSVSVHSTLPWLAKLFEWVRDIKEAGIPLFGSGFGHLAIAKALGGEIKTNAFGWSLGVEVVEWTEEEFHTSDDIQQSQFYSAHREHVSRPPPGSRIVGLNPRTPIAAMTIGENIFTTQYHPEIPQDFMLALVDSMKDKMGAELQHAQEAVHWPVATEDFSRNLVAFFTSFRHHDDDDGVARRAKFAEKISRQAGQLALEYFSDIPSLKISSKGIQDVVSNADQNVEQLIRDQIAHSFPDDGIIGEEFEDTYGHSGFNWVIDPIDGTSNFVRGIAAWAIVVACTYKSQIVIGSIFDPVHHEHFFCRRHHGAQLNGKAICASGHKKLSEGLTGIGTSSLAETHPIPALTGELLNHDALFVKNGSGALGLAYTACGRYVAYIEDHMKSWDCLAGLLLAEESGAIVHDFDFERMMRRGSRVVVAPPSVIQEVRVISQKVLSHPQ